MELVIKQVRIVDPANGRDQVSNVYVKDGKIAEISDADHPAKQVIDGTGLVAVPGLVDIHVHLRDPGLTYKEDITTGTAAAAAGGFTSIFAMPNTEPVTDNVETIAYVEESARKAGNAHVYVMPAMTVGQQGKEVCDFAAYRAHGIVAVTDDGKAVADPLVARQVMEQAKQWDLLPVTHSDDVRLVNGGVMNEGEVSRRLGVKGNPSISEELMVERDILLAQYVGHKVHIQHMSSGTSVALVREAQRRGVDVTCETGPHYIALTDEWVEKVGANARMNPPLRTERDRQLILQGIADGTITILATDHAPHSAKEKEGPLASTMNGIVGLETAFPIYYTYLVKEGIIPLGKLVELTSTNPARRVGIPKGTLSIGADADVMLFDPDATYTIDKNTFRSKGRNTPFDGMEVCGKVKYTILSGRVVYENHNQ